MPSRILITGYSGFVGGYLVELCHTYYPDAALFGLSEHPNRSGATPGMRDLIPLTADITEPEPMRRAVARAQPDVVFHLAGQPSVAASWADPVRTLWVNAAGVIHLLEALRAEHLTPRVVLVGSGEQYGMVRPEDNPIREECVFRPANPYAVAKAAEDLYGYQYFVAYGMQVVRVRPFNHFGPRQAAAFGVASFARPIAEVEAGKAEPMLLVGNLTARRDFLPVEDVVRAYVALADRGRAGEAYNVGSGLARSIQEGLDRLLSRARVAIQVREHPSRLRPVDVPVVMADTTRLRADTGWAPSTDFEGALDRTLDYWRARAPAGDTGALPRPPPTQRR